MNPLMEALAWLREFRLAVWYSTDAWRDRFLIYGFQPAIVCSLWIPSTETYGGRWTGFRIPFCPVIHPRDFHRFDDTARFGRLHK